MKIRGAVLSLHPRLPAHQGPARHEPASRPRVTAAAAAAMWLLLGTLLAVTTSSDLSSKPSREHRSLCGPDEYLHAGRCCQRCPAGQYVHEPCSSPHSQSECATCDIETYTAFPNGERSCLHCYSCSEDQEVVAECTSTSNRVCQCQTGLYYGHPDSPENCTPCSPCPHGKVVLQTCNSTADTVCGLPGPVSHSRHRFFVIGGCLFPLIFMTIIFFCIKKPEHRGDETECRSLQDGHGDGRESVGPERSATFRSLLENPGADSPGPRAGDLVLDMVSESPILPRTPETPAGVDGPQSAAGAGGWAPRRHHRWSRLHQADYSVCDSEED